MIEAIKDVSQIFERTLTNNQGDFVTGETITFEVRNSSTDSLITSGTMTEQNEVYKFSFTFTSLIEARVKFFTPSGFPDDLESVRVIEAPATEANVDANETKIDALQVDLTQVLSDIAGLNDLGISDIQTALTNQGYTIARASNLDNLDATVSSRSSHTASDVTTDMDANSVDLNQILADIASLNDISITDVQTALTNQGYTVVRASNLDNLDTTVSSRASEANASTNTANIIAEIDANELDLDEINAKITLILGLSQHNTQIKDTVYDANGNLTSATIKLYANATDAINDTNTTKTYSVIATFNAQDQLQTYIVSDN